MINRLENHIYNLISFPPKLSLITLGERQSPLSALRRWRRSFRVSRKWLWTRRSSPIGPEGSGCRLPSRGCLPSVRAERSWGAAASWGVGLWLGLLGGFGLDQENEHVADPPERTEHHQAEADRDLLTGGLAGVLGVDGESQSHEDPKLDCSEDHPQQKTFHNSSRWLSRYPADLTGLEMLA